MDMDILVPILFLKTCLIFALVLMNQTEKIITGTENCITLVLVGVILVCKAHSAGKDVFEEYYNIASVSTYVFGYLFQYFVELVMFCFETYLLIKIFIRY